MSLPTRLLRRRPHPAGARTPPGRRANLLLGGGAVVVVLLIVVALGRGDDAAGPAAGAPAPSSGTTTAGPGDGGTTTAPATADPGDTSAPTGAARRLLQQLEAALASPTIPVLRPPVADLGADSWRRGAEQAGCLEATAGGAARCAYGSADSPDTLMLVGDEASTAYLPAVRKALEGRFRIRQLTLPGCPVWYSPVLGPDGSPYAACDAHREFVRSEVRDYRPDVLVLATSWQATTRIDTGGIQGAPEDAVVAGYERALKDLVPAARLAVVLAPPPGGADLQACAAAGGDATDCVAGVPAAFGSFVGVEKTIADSSGAVYLDTRGWFCVQAKCPSFVGRTPVYADGVHLTRAYAEVLGDVMREGLAAAAAQLR